MPTDLIAIIHKIVYSNESFEHYHPVRTLSTLNQMVGHFWHWHIRLIGALQQIYQKKTNNKIPENTQNTMCR